jgi:hypothetical protein
MLGMFEEQQGSRVRNQVEDVDRASQAIKRKAYYSE